MAAGRCKLNAKSCDGLNEKLTAVRAFRTPTPGRPLGDVAKAGQTLVDILTSTKDHKIRHLIEHGVVKLYLDICVSLSVHLRGKVTTSKSETRNESLRDDVYSMLDVQTKLIMFVQSASADMAAAGDDIVRLSEAGMLDITVALSFCMTRVPFEGANVTQLATIISREADGRPDRGVCQAITDLFSLFDYHDAFTRRTTEGGRHVGLEHPWELLAQQAMEILSKKSSHTNPSVTKMASLLVYHSARIPESEVVTLTRLVTGLAQFHRDRHAVPPHDFVIFGNVLRMAALTIDAQPRDIFDLILAYVETAMQKYKGRHGELPGQWGYDLARLALRSRLEPRRGERRHVRGSPRDEASWRLLSICVLRSYQSQKLVDYLSTPDVLDVVLELADAFAPIGLVSFLSHSETALAAFTTAKGARWVIQLSLRRMTPEGRELFSEIPHFHNGRPMLVLLVRNVEHGSQSAAVKSSFVRDLLDTQLTSDYNEATDNLMEWRLDRRTFGDSAMLVDFLAQTDEGCRAVTKGCNLHLRLVGMIHFQLNTQLVGGRLQGSAHDLLVTFRHTMSVLVSTALSTPAAVVQALTDGFGEPGNIQLTFVDFILLASTYAAVDWAKNITPLFEGVYAVSLVLQAALDRRSVPTRKLERYVLEIASKFRTTLEGERETAWHPSFYYGMLCLSILYEYFPETMRVVPLPNRTQGDEWNDFVSRYCQLVLDQPDTSPEVARLARDVSKEIKLLKRGKSSGVVTSF